MERLIMSKKIDDFLQDHTIRDLALMAQCQSIFFHVMVSLLCQQAPSVEVLILPLTWLQPHLCLFVEFALLVDLQDFLCCLQ